MHVLCFQAAFKHLLLFDTSASEHQCPCLQGFWDAMTLLSQHRRDDTPVVGAPVRTKSVAPTLAWLHAQKLEAKAEAH